MVSYRSWMSSLPEGVKSLPINCIHLPGTHDSAAYVLDFDHPISDSLWFRAASYAAGMFCCIGDTIRDWTITQENSVYEQLNRGIRYLDLRVNYSFSDDTFYTTHTFTEIQLERILEEVLRFLEENREEVIVLAAKPGWFDRQDLNLVEENRLIEIFQKYLGKYFATCTKDCRFDETMSVAKMAERNQRVIFYFRGNFIHGKNYIWQPQNFQLPWDNTSNLQEKKRDLRNDLKGMVKSEYRLNGLAFKMTPSNELVQDDVLNRIFCSCCYQPQSTRSLSLKAQKYLSEFLIENKDQMDKVSIITTDFPSQSFIGLVIGLNMARIKELV